MSRYAIKDADFKLFTVLWNQRMGLPTPPLHLRMAEWLERRWIKRDRRLLLMAFRSSGKSTIVGLFAAWLLYRQPDLRILVLAADQPLARKMVRNVKRILERHPLTHHLLPEKADQWASDRFTIKRLLELRDPSMLAKSIGSNITGSRADIVICDDVEVPSTCDTPQKRLELRERLAEMNYLMPDGSGTQLYMGTPHSYYSIYADTPRREIGEEEIFLSGFHRLTIPVLDEAGQSAWADRFSPQDLELMRRQTGPAKFESQMMLRPMNIQDGHLNPELLNIYDHELDYTREIQTLFLGSTKIISGAAWWDPAFAGAKNDRSVLACVFADEEGNYYLHRLVYIRSDTADSRDEATQQCAKIALQAKELMLPSLAVEINGIGRFLPAILRNELVRAKAPCAVQEITSRRPKDIRILEAFDAVLAARRLYMHRSVLKTPFMAEMQEWRPGAGKGHDDGLDAVAGALSLQPVRLKRLTAQGGHGWMKSGKTHTAQTEFEV
jgi:hypothetical protein